ncbi:beta-lactamase family protein [Gammaproteobacteria bacterium]|nr:beta-lactamase family protein [Gammaproteobacteria bacterium]MDB3868320.1 beta-lactamase family protein [Gammaproteobacteria bacterium]MDC0440563.1 beta-lactamase family protein [Gammaproteobacteria bacterium]MDC0884387.1 serine hydrolase [Gammaproteobacteria bacterium]
MRIFISILVFFFTSAPIYSNSIDANDKNKITKHFNAYIDNGSLPNISILIKKDNKEIYRHSHGYADIKNEINVSKNSVFRIYSMTKPVTGVAIMQLVESGQLRLNDKVSRYIPAFKNTKVINLEFQDYVVKPKREITIRDLLTHTSGLTYSWAGEGPVNQIYRKYNIRPYYFGALDAELNKFPGNTCQFAAAAASAPLLHNPGEKWSYGINMDILGCVVEVITKMTFADYLKKNIFDPLNLKSMGFSVQPSDRDNFTTLYTSGAFSRDGEVVAPSGLNQAELMFSKELRSIDAYDKSPYLNNSSKLFDGGSGLVSNIDDYSKFAEMLLNGGVLNGVRILSQASVDLMSKNHLSNEILSDGAAFGLAGVGMGLTVGTIMNPGIAGTYSAKGEFFWGGAASTIFWVDKKNNITATMMTQYMPSDKYPLREELKTLVYSSLSN